MSTLELNGKDFATQTSSAEPVLASTVTGGAGLSGSTSLGTVTSGSIGSGVTGFTGIKEADLWRLTTATTNDTDFTSNIERADSYGFGKLGTGMTESSGIFTFPSTGYWEVSFQMMVYYNGDSRWNDAIIYVSTNSGSSWGKSAQTSCFIQQTSSDTTFSSCNLSTIIDVTSTSTVKVKFKADVTNSSAIVAGNTNETQTGFKFIRLGDT
jgi:hypothetical protein